MPSLIKRIASRFAGQAMDTPRPAHDDIDPDVLLPQVRAALTAIEATLADLDRREQDLLVEASVLYEQLMATAAILADIRHEKAIAADNAATFQAAIQTLQPQHPSAYNVDLGTSDRHEALVVQPKT
jgi:hypothetical protein